MENKPVGSTERTAADPDMKRRMGRVKKDTGSFFDGARGGKYDLDPKNKNTGSFFDGARGGKYDKTTPPETPPAAPKAPEKPLRSIDPSVERRLSVGAERGIRWQKRLEH